MKRTVAVLLRRAPFGRVHVAEGLRAGSGVAAGFDNHDVTVVFAEDAVHATRMSAEWDALDMSPHLADLAEGNARLVVDAGALAEREIDDHEVAAEVEIRDSDAVNRILRTADRQLTF